MLKKLLSEKICASCKICCIFNTSEFWEMPLVTDKVKILSDELTNNKQNYEIFNGRRIFGIKSENGMAKCPMLSESGCILKDEKPFDCKIWPFRVMRLNDNFVLTLSPLCKSLYDLPLSTISDFTTKEFISSIKTEIEETPDIVKEYIDGYPIIVVL